MGRGVGPYLKTHQIPRPLRPPVSPSSLSRVSSSRSKGFSPASLGITSWCVCKKGARQATNLGAGSKALARGC
ncbi:unnamed protein product [Mycena citricolor]|uniref:Uncharacterized protein n=1 Tax=Mycena citricolor TaxID=2018698 RepID=A0AAD2H0W7_9AGAR|nr:unnamed protein product [Mycena citricolor]